MQFWQIKRFVVTLRWAKSVGTIFQQHFLSVSYCGNSCNISSFFIIIVFSVVTCNQWSLALRLWHSEGSVSSAARLCLTLCSPHGLQHARLASPPPAPGACSNSCPLSRWCHPTMSCSVVPFSSCLQSFSALGFFPRSQFFTSGGQTIGVSALASVLPMNIQDWFPLGLTCLISLQSKGLSRIFSNTTVQKHQFFGA